MGARRHSDRLRRNDDADVVYRRYKEIGEAYPGYDLLINADIDAS